MLWKFNTGTRMYIPGLTENKETVKYIKMLCSRKGENKSIFHMKNYRTINPFPGNSEHSLMTATYSEFFTYGDGSRDEWTQLQILHFIGNWQIDGVEAKLKSNGSVHFEYYRTFIMMCESSERKLWEEEPYYLDSDMIDWSKFSDELKLWCISSL